MTDANLAGVRKTEQTSLQRQLVGDLDWIVMKALEKDRELRYAAASELAEDLRRYLHDQPVIAGPHSRLYRVRKFLHRHKMAASAGLLVAISLVIGSGLAGWKAHEAFVEKRRAEERLMQMLELANRSLFDVHDSIERLPGAMEARRKIVGTTLQFLEELSKEEENSTGYAGQDKQLRLALSAAYFRLGDTQGYIQKPNLGDTAGALRSYRQAAHLIEPLRERNLEDPDLLLRWLEILRRTGDALYETGELKAAESTFRNAIPTAQALARLSPSNTEAVRQEGLLYEDLSDALQHTNPEQALQYAHKALEITGLLDAAHPGNSSILYQLSDAHAEMGRILNRRGNLKEALEHFRQCASLRETVVRMNPNDIVFRRNLLIAYGHVGATLGLPTVNNLGDSRGALEYYRKAVAIAREIVASDPRDSTGQYDLASAMLRMASIDVPRSERGASLEALQQAAGILEKLSAADPTAIRYRHGLVIAYEYAGHRLRELGRPDEAKAQYLRELELTTATLAAHPDDTPSLSTLLKAHKALADLLASQGDRAAAAEQTRLAISEAGHLCERCSTDVRATYISESYLNAALLYRTLADWGEVRAAARHAAENLLTLPVCSELCIQLQHRANFLIGEAARQTQVAAADK